MAKLILLTNDDGIGAPGLQALRRSVAHLGEVVMVAPERDTSGAGHSLTMHRPLLVRQIDQWSYAIDGTPTDCVTIALEKIVKRAPDLLIAGINPGANLGDDITYSGTVSAAIEGTMMGIPSFAISLAGDAPFSYQRAQPVAADLAARIMATGLPVDTLLNVNVPGCARKPVICLTHQGRRTYAGAVQETHDPWGRIHYWIGGGSPSLDHRRSSDAQAIAAGAISITPIHLDLTNYAAMETLRDQWPIFAPERDKND